MLEYKIAKIIVEKLHFLDRIDLQAKLFVLTSHSIFY